MSGPLGLGPSANRQGVLPRLRPPNAGGARGTATFKALAAFLRSIYVLLGWPMIPQIMVSVSHDSVLVSPQHVPEKSAVNGLWQKG
jgi:hypothetical protein